ncbi:DoxX family protein [Tomitella fengzijianii]|uniref:DoxX family protein n=1 Tax=Tomitella fengzijianii TaxID=2597660 RepID=A0A516WZU2_9ACTN|nr:DoxX family protein [Tomitella fengzijianii]QDQ96376.1 DoxX family protein [Tomitella fengzijianii]
MNRSAGHIRSLGLLLARVGIGAVFLAHGLQKLNTWGHAGTAAAFDAMGAPLPDVTAFLATWVEILGGAALIAGLLVPLAGVLLAVDMIGAVFIAHIDSGIWVGDGGYELALALGAGALGLAAAGAGRLSLDALAAPRMGRKLRFAASPA